MKRHLWCLLAFFAFGVSLHAQELTLDPDSTAKGAQIETARIDPSLSSPVKSANEFFNLTATRDDAAAEIQIAHDFGYTNGGKNLVFLKVSAPIKKTDTQKDLADLHGLEGAATAEFGLNRLIWSPTFVVNTNLSPAERGPDLFKRWKQACKEDNAKGFDPNSDSICAMQDLSPSAQSKLIDWGPMPRLLALSAEYGSQQFKFLDPTTLKPGKASHYPYAVNGTFGVFPLVGGWYYTGVNLSAGRGYEGQAQTSICQPLGTTGALQCGDFALGAPDGNTTKIAQFEARYYMNNRLALNPKVSFDFEKKRHSVELPVYFIHNGDGALNGGISIGWRSDTKQVTAVAFVGQMADIVK